VCGPCLGRQAAGFFLVFLLLDYDLRAFTSFYFLRPHKRTAPTPYDDLGTMSTAISHHISPLSSVFRLADSNTHSTAKLIATAVYHD